GRGKLDPRLRMKIQDSYSSGVASYARKGLIKIQRGNNLCRSQVGLLGRFCGTEGCVCGMRCRYPLCSASQGAPTTASAESGARPSHAAPKNGADRAMSRLCRITARQYRKNALPTWERDAHRRSHARLEGLAAVPAVATCPGHP